MRALLMVIATTLVTLGAILFIVPAAVAVTPRPTAAIELPAASYPWVQPAWISVRGTRRVVIPRAALAGVGSVQPPAWILAG